MNIGKVFGSIVVKHKESSETQFHILVMKKYQKNLKQYFLNHQNHQIEFNDLLKIIFNLFDGLIELRINNIIHSDIKPQNILITEQGECVYIDFGISQKVTKDQKIEAKGCTPLYCHEKQLKNSELGFYSDVYSLGKTLLQCIDDFEKYNQNTSQSQTKIIKIFKDYMNTSMAQDQIENIKECQELHQLFIEQIYFQEEEKHKEEFEEFYEYYLKKLDEIINIFRYDLNHDMEYSMKQKLNYQLIYLRMLQLKQAQNEKQISETLKNIALSYVEMGDYNNAKNYMLEFKQMQEQSLNDKQQGLIYSLQALGMIYSGLNDHQIALNHYFQSLEMARQFYNGNHPFIAKVLGYIGNSYIQMGDLQIGLKYHLESLEMNQQIHQESHPDVFQSLYKVGMTYRRLGDYNNSLQYYEQSLEVALSYFKGDHRFIEKVLSQIVDIYKKIDDVQQEEEYCQRSLLTRLDENLVYNTEDLEEQEIIKSDERLVDFFESIDQEETERITQPKKR